MMKAYTYQQYGSSDVLRLTDLLQPEPMANEVLIKTKASSINDWDWGLLSGDWVNRILNGLRKPKKINVLGLDVAGTVVALGSSVDNLKIGDRVHADLSSHGFGGYAEFVTAPANEFTVIPDHMSFEEAAAIPHSGMLAYQSLIDQWDLADKQKILINGAGGGVGPIALAIAKQFDVEVTGVDRTEKLDMLKALGFDHVIDFTQENFTQLGQKYDLIFDVKTLQSPWAFAKALKKGGKYITVGGSIPRLLSTLILNPFLAPVLKKSFKIVSLEPNKNLKYVNDLFLGGTLKLLIDGPYPFDQLRQAMDHYQSGKQKGRVVIKIP